MEDIAAAANKLKKAYQQYIDANLAYNKSIGMRHSLAVDTVWVKMPKGDRGRKWKTIKTK